MSAPTGEPILIPCEGSGCPPCTVAWSGPEGETTGMCAMCGRWHPVDDDNIVAEHTRADIIARINRGDFG